MGAPDTWDEANAVAVQDDGRIVIGGSVDSQAAVLRLTATGALDAEFQGGIVPVFERGSPTVLCCPPAGTGRGSSATVR
jgi:hypothetical protein